jgi:hypothetical protein
MILRLIQQAHLHTTKGIVNQRHPLSENIRDDGLRQIPTLKTLAFGRQTAQTRQNCSEIIKGSRVIRGGHALRISACSEII